MSEPRSRRPRPEGRTAENGSSRGRAGADPAAGLLAELIPLLRDGLVILRTILDIAIDRLDQIEEGRTYHVRRETYETILTVIDQEIARLEAEEPSDAVEAQLETLRALRNVLERQLRRTQPPPPGKGKGKGKGPGKGAGPAGPGEGGEPPPARKRKLEID